MYTLNWGDLTPEKFLSEYWQKKPLLIKNAFNNFNDPIDANELAGLAMEQEIESRIVAKQNSGEQMQWQVTHGPFENFDDLGENGWTLLVQAVNNFSRKTHQLISPFNFIPSWRIDDVMVSFSTPEGGVGAHLDQYDVFIIQGEGKRRWQVGLPDENLSQLLPHPDLKQVGNFPAIIDEVTEPGDLLYIPPNHPHNGIALDNSLNYSIGFQAPNNQELFSAFADKLIDDDSEINRFSDIGRKVATSPEQLDEKDVASLNRFMHSAIDDKQTFKQFIGCYLTRSHHALELLIPVEPIDTAHLDAILAEQENTITAVSGIKSLVINDSKDDNANLFINGEQFKLDNDSIEFAHVLAQGNTLTTNKAKSFTFCLKNHQLLTNVLNKGYWYIE